MAFNRTLVDEIRNDPLARGYSGMTDAQIVTSLNTVDRDNERTTMSAGEVMESIDGTEFAALSAADKTRVDRVLGLGAEIVIGPGNAHNAVQELLVFGGGSATITALAAMRNQQISRAQEVGAGIVNLNTVGAARNWGG